MPGFDTVRRERWLAAVIALAAIALVAWLIGVGHGGQSMVAKQDERPAPPSAGPGGQATAGGPGPSSPAVPSSTGSTPSRDLSPTVPTAATDGAAPPTPIVPRELGRDEVAAALAAGDPGMEVLASRLPTSDEPIAARWQTGDEWVVETWYRQMQAHDERWSGPALWRFRVEREVGFHDVACFEVVVTRSDESAPPVTIYVSRDAQRLVGLETTVTQQGKTQRVVHAPDGGDRAEPAAVRGEFTAAPVHLPPRGAFASTSPAGLPFERGPLRATFPGMPAQDDLVGRGGPYLDLEYPDPRDGTTVRQRWTKSDMRWPVVTRTETTLSFRRG